MVGSGRPGRSGFGRDGLLGLLELLFALPARHHHAQSGPDSAAAGRGFLGLGRRWGRTPLCHRLSRQRLDPALRPRRDRQAEGGRGGAPHHPVRPGRPGRRSPVHGGRTGHRRRTVADPRLVAVPALDPDTRARMDGGRHSGGRRQSGPRRRGRGQSSVRRPPDRTAEGRRRADHLSAGAVAGSGRIPEGLRLRRQPRLAVHPRRPERAGSGRDGHARCGRRLGALRR